MNLPAGLAVALGILVLLPLAAVAVGPRWRDPPRERWGISPERLAAAGNTPELVAYRRRIELGVADPRKEAVVNRAIQTGTAAPRELRAATRELARAAAAEPGGGAGGGERCRLMGRRAHCPVLTHVGHFEGSYVLTPGGSR